MKRMKVGVILLALLLAAMAMVPMANAASGENGPNVSMAVVTSERQIPLPVLIFNKTAKPIQINNELKVEVSDKTSETANSLITSASSDNPIIPEGAIVYHSNGGLTTVFNSNGQQRFVAEDAQSPMINTPNGVFPATYIIEVPDKSLIDDTNNSVKVFYNNKRILTIIDESSFGTSKIALPRATTTQQYPIEVRQWVEWTETNIIPDTPITRFAADFNVPKAPVQTVNYNNDLSGSASTIWPGLYTSDDKYLLQPVLEWYMKHKYEDTDPSEANWSIATWYVTPRHTTLVSTRRYGDGVTKISRNDQMHTNIQDMGQWYGSIADTTLGISSSLFLTDNTDNHDLNNYNLKAYLVLEGWDEHRVNPDNYNSDYLPGSVNFTNIVINSAAPWTAAGYVNSLLWSVPNYGLSVDNSTWPTSVTLNTGNS